MGEIIETPIGNENKEAVSILEKIKNSLKNLFNKEKDKNIQQEVDDREDEEELEYEVSCSDYDGKNRATKISIEYHNYYGDGLTKKDMEQELDIDEDEVKERTYKYDNEKRIIEVNVTYH